MSGDAYAEGYRQVIGVDQRDSSGAWGALATRDAGRPGESSAARLGDLEGGHEGGREGNRMENRGGYLG